MVLIKRHQGFEIPEREATPEGVYLNRRHFIKLMGLGSASLISGCDRLFDLKGGGSGGGGDGGNTLLPKTPTSVLYPAQLNPAYTLDRPLTDELVAAKYNNFYEFSSGKEDVWRLAERLKTRPWEVAITGLVERPGVWDIDRLVRKMQIEERLYRFRCVEAWAMAIPWTGFPMIDLIKAVKPLSSAKYVKMTTFLDESIMPGAARKTGLPWPYTEGLTIEEATNELAFIATGIYGRELKRQHGAPIRLVVPWKYGFKSIKSIVRIEFTATVPPTFWNTVAPGEYDFSANVDPDVPHPRWSQKTERMLGSRKRRPTVKYNGYGDLVAHMY